jgi:hypothetical protein
MSCPKTRLTRILAPRTVAFGCVVTSDFSMFRAGSLARKYVEKLWWRIFLMVSSGACRFLLFSITYIWFRSSRCVESSLGNWSQKGAQKGGRLAGRADYPQVHPFRPWLGRFHITHSYPEISCQSAARFANDAWCGVGEMEPVANAGRLAGQAPRKGGASRQALCRR